MDADAGGVAGDPTDADRQAESNASATSGARCQRRSTVRSRPFVARMP
jgi:hypothetical protein